MMRPSRWLTTLTLVLTEARFCTSSALLHLPTFGKREDLNELGWKASRRFEGELERRGPQAPTDNGGLSLSAPDVERNTSTLRTCQDSMSTMSNVSNEVGFAACYNILDWHQNMNGMFQADLRLFKIANATGQFANVPANSLAVNLTYPASTQASGLMNTESSDNSSVNPAQDPSTGHTQVSQFSLVGGWKIQLDANKLNSTELMSLLIPQISLVATVNGTVMSTNISSADTIYFVAGQFSDQVTRDVVMLAASPVMAEEAITVSKGFVLPGTTFGIFPTGLIVTSAWMVLFLLAFGLGTVGRMRHRDIYRKRLAVTTRIGRK